MLNVEFVVVLQVAPWAAEELKLNPAMKEQEHLIS